MATRDQKPWEHPEIEESSQARYIAGYVASLALLALSLALVLTHAVSGVTLLTVVSVIAWVTVMTQLILLFHLNFSETQRWNSLTLMLNVPLLILSVGLSAWMFSQLYTHVMSPSLMPH